MKRFDISRFSGIFVILLLYFGWCCKTVAYSNRLFLLISFTCSMAALVIYIRTVNRSGIYDAYDLKSLNILLIIVCLIISYGAFYDSIHIAASEKVTKMLMLGQGIDPANLTLAFESIIWCLMLVYMTYSHSRNILESKSGEDTNISIVNRIVAFVKNFAGIISFLLIAGLLCYDPDWYQFKWDGLLYYLASFDLNMASISSLAVYGHIAQGYGVILKIFNYLIHDHAYAIFAANVFVYLLGVLYFYRTIRFVIKEADKVFCVLGTAIYAFSPFYLGMVNYFSLDYYLMCILPMVVFYAYKRDWVRYTIAGCIFCFTKEPAIIIYAGICLGILICDLMRGRVIMRKLFNTVRYYCMALPCIMWVSTYKMLGPWSAGNSEVAVQGTYILAKMKVLYLFSFNWVFTAFICLFCIIALVKKTSVGNIDLFIPLLCGQILFTLFSAVFVTSNHPRYIDSSPYVLYVITIILVFYIISNRYIKRSIMMVLACVMLISSYVTIDPISQMIFKRIDIGDTYIVTTSSSYGDGSIYNKQMLGLERAFSMAIADSIEESIPIVVPVIDGSVYAYDGMSEHILLLDSDNMSDIQLFDTGRRLRSVVENPQTERFCIDHLTEKSDMSEVIGKGRKISLIYPNGIDIDKLEKLTNQLKISESREYKHKGWVIHRIKGTVIDE